LPSEQEKEISVALFAMFAALVLYRIVTVEKIIAPLAFHPGDEGSIARSKRSGSSRKNIRSAPWYFLNGGSKYVPA